MCRNPLGIYCERWPKNCIGTFERRGLKDGHFKFDNSPGREICQGIEKISFCSTQAEPKKCDAYLVFSSQTLLTQHTVLCNVYCFNLLTKSCIQETLNLSTDVGMSTISQSNSIICWKNGWILFVIAEQY